MGLQRKDVPTSVMGDVHQFMAAICAAAVRDGPGCLVWCWTDHPLSKLTTIAWTTSHPSADKVHGMVVDNLNKISASSQSS